MNSRLFLGVAIAATALTLPLAGTASAQVLYDNGPAAIGGQSVIRPGGSTYGLNSQTGVYTVADNFTVGSASGWTVSAFSFFAYETGAQNTFSFSGLSWSVVAGDVNTGTLIASGSEVPTNGGLVGYRNNQGGNNELRAIFQLDVDVSDFSLNAGSYWLRWDITGSLPNSYAWVPPTADGAVGNAMQKYRSDSGFGPSHDDGDNLGVEFPFIIRGPGNTTPVPEPATLAMLYMGGLMLALSAFRRRRIN